ELPIGSYRPLFVASDLVISAVFNGSVLEDGNSIGSRYLGLTVPTGSMDVAGGVNVPLSAASAYAGANRVFALVRSKLRHGLGVNMVQTPVQNDLGQTQSASPGWGPTAVATCATGFQVVDLGVFRVPTN